VTIGELNDPAKAQEIENWLNQVEASFAALAMDSSCFRESARLMAGKSGAYFEDAMIAATGRVHGLIVATRNERDFRQFQVALFNPFQFAA
jgi:toxin FitB